MEIKKPFIDSLDQLKKYWQIAIPQIIGVIIPFVFIYLGFQMTGLGEMFHGYFEANTEFNEESMETYLEQYDYSFMESTMTKKNIEIIFILILTNFVIGTFLSCITFSLIRLMLLKKSISWKQGMKDASLFFGKLIILQLLMFVIFVGPLGIGFLLFMLAFIGMGLAAIGVAVILGVCYLIYVAIVTLRLYFVRPMLFLQDKSAIEAIKSSYQITFGRLKDVIMVMLVVYGLGVLATSLVQGPLSTSTFTVAYGGDQSIITSAMFFALLFIIFQGVIGAFQQIFLFNAYNEFRKNG